MTLGPKAKLLINLKISSERCYFCDLFVRMVVVHFKKVFAITRKGVDVGSGCSSS